MKHNLFDPFEKIDGNNEYTEKHSIYEFTWWPIWLACIWGHIDILYLFLQDPSLEKVEEFSFDLQDIIRQGHTNIIRLLLETEKFIYRGFNSELTLAIQAGHIDYLTRILFVKQLTMTEQK